MNDRFVIKMAVLCREMIFVVVLTLIVVALLWYVSRLMENLEKRAPSPPGVKEKPGEPTDTDAGERVPTTEDQPPPITTTDEDQPFVPTSRDDDVEVNVERGPMGCPTTKLFYGYHCELGDDLEFERIKGKTFRRFHVGAPKKILGWGKEQLKACAKECKSRDGCKGFSVRSSGLGEAASHYCTFHARVNVTKDGPQYKSFCLDELDSCGAVDDVTTSRDDDFWA